MQVKLLRPDDSVITSVISLEDCDMQYVKIALAQAYNKTFDETSLSEENWPAILLMERFTPRVPDRNEGRGKSILLVPDNSWCVVKIVPPGCHKPSGVPGMPQFWEGNDGPKPCATCPLTRDCEIKEVPACRAKCPKLKNGAKPCFSCDNAAMKAGEAFARDVFERINNYGH